MFLKGLNTYIITISLITTTSACIYILLCKEYILYTNKIYNEIILDMISLWCLYEYTYPKGSILISFIHMTIYSIMGVIINKNDYLEKIIQLNKGGIK